MNPQSTFNYQKGVNMEFGRCKGNNSIYFIIIIKLITITKNDQVLSILNCVYFLYILKSYFAMLAVFAVLSRFRFWFEVVQWKAKFEICLYIYIYFFFLMHVKVDPSPSFCFRNKKYIYKNFKPEKSVIVNLIYA